MDKAVDEIMEDVENLSVEEKHYLLGVIAYLEDCNND